MGLLTRWKRKGGESASTEPQLLAPGIHTIEPGVLSVVVDEDDVQQAPSGPLPSPPAQLLAGRSRYYLTRGLERFGQHEVMFVLAPHGGSIPIGFEQDVLNMLRMICSLASQGRTVAADDLTVFGDRAPFGLPGCGLAYLERTEGLGPEVPNDVLLAVFMRPEECVVAQAVGVRRVAAWLGYAYRMFPYPKFSDPSRSTVIPDGLPQTALAGLPLVWAGQAASVSLEQKAVTLRMKTRLIDTLRTAFEARENNRCFAIIAGHAPRADGRFVWLPKRESPEAIGMLGSTLSVVEGGFLALIGNCQRDEVLVVEDGFSALLRQTSWQQVRQAIESAQAVSLPMSGESNRFVRELRFEFEALSHREDSIE